jgi:hypothetical protein
MKDARGQAKRERAYYQRDELQQCIVCARLFVRRRDNVCSISCKAKLDSGQEGRQSQ